MAEGEEVATNNHQVILDRIESGGYTRAELIKLRANAEVRRQRGDPVASAVVAAIDRGVPIDRSVVFMGFCPGASFDNRRDIEWKAKGICDFTFAESKHQLARFNNIWPGDLIVLKKRQEFGKTMRLYGHGRVVGVKYDANGARFLEMNWSAQGEIIEVPLLGANSTVDVRTIERVEREMPASFFEWLGISQQA